MTIGERLKKLRKEKGVTLVQMSADIGIAQSSLSRYENGEREPTKMEQLQKLANYFGVTIPYLQGQSKFKYNEFFPDGVKNEYLLQGRNKEYLKNLSLFDILGQRTAEKPLNLAAQKGIVIKDADKDDIARTISNAFYRVVGEALAGNHETLDELKGLLGMDFPNTETLTDEYIDQKLKRSDHKREINWIEQHLRDIYDSSLSDNKK